MELDGGKERGFTLAPEGVDSQGTEEVQLRPHKLANNTIPSELVKERHNTSAALFICNLELPRSDRVLQAETLAKGL